MDISTIIIKTILIVLIIHLSCSAWILFIADSRRELLNSFDYLLIFTMAPGIIFLFIICKLLDIKGGDRWHLQQIQNLKEKLKGRIPWNKGKKFNKETGKYE